MRISRIFQAQSFTTQQAFHFDAAASHYLATVLRLNVGDNVIVFNGQGGEYLATLTSVTKKQVSGLIKSFHQKNSESPLRIHLAQAISRSEKMDFTIQKSVELGVTDITPIFSERVNVKLSDDRLENRLQHWQAVIVSACEQSGRVVVPTLHAPKKLHDWLAQPPCDLNFILHPEACDKKAMTHTPRSVSLLIGPEGGFSDTEVSTALQKNWLALTLGPRILRTETAGLVAVTLLQQRWGDFSIE